MRAYVCSGPRPESPLVTGIFNIGVRALQTNQAVLQTIGNNIANVNTEGYSRQRVTMQQIDLVLCYRLYLYQNYYLPYHPKQHCY